MADKNIFESIEDKENEPSNNNPNRNGTSLFENLDGFIGNWAKQKANYEMTIKQMGEENGRKKQNIEQLRRKNAQGLIEVQQKELLIKKYDESIKQTEALLEPLINKLVGLNVITSALVKESIPEVKAEMEKAQMVNGVFETFCVNYENEWQRIKGVRDNDIETCKKEIGEIENKSLELKERITFEQRELKRLNDEYLQMGKDIKNSESFFETLKESVNTKKEERAEKLKIHNEIMEDLKKSHDEKMSQKQQEIAATKSELHKHEQEEEFIRKEIANLRQKNIEQNSINDEATERIKKVQYENDERRQKIVERLQKKIQLKKKKESLDERKKEQELKISSEKEVNKILLESLKKEKDIEAKIDMKKMLIGARKREIDMRKQAAERKEGLIIEEQKKIKKICEEITDMKLELERNEEEKGDIQQSLEGLDKEKKFIHESMARSNESIIEIRNKKSKLMEELQALKMGSIDRLNEVFKNSSSRCDQDKTFP